MQIILSFSKNLRLEEGGFGSVYKATIDNPTWGDYHSLPLTITVKKLNRQSPIGISFNYAKLCLSDYIIFFKFRKQQFFLDIILFR